MSVAVGLAMSAATRGHVSSGGGGDGLAGLIGALVLWAIVGLIIWSVFFVTQPNEPYRAKLKEGKLIYGAELPEYVEVTVQPQPRAFILKSKLLASMPDGVYTLEFRYGDAVYFGPAQTMKIHHFHPCVEVTFQNEKL